MCVSLIWAMSTTPRMPFRSPLGFNLRALSRDRRLTLDAGKSYFSFVKRATITEAKNQLSALIDRVRHGETVVITDRGRPVARLVSALTAAPEDAEGRLARLERRGGLRRATASPPRSLPKLARAKRPSGVLEALLDERREGR